MKLRKSVRFPGRPRMSPRLPYGPAGLGRTRNKQAVDVRRRPRGITEVRRSIASRRKRVLGRTSPHHAGGSNGLGGPGKCQTKAEAEDLMRLAADEEDAMEKSPATPGPVVPAREQLGDLLLATAPPVRRSGRISRISRECPRPSRSNEGLSQAAQPAIKK